MAKRDYYVVLEHIGEDASTGEKIIMRTRYCFESRRKFKKWYYPMFEEIFKIVEKGITKERTIELSSCIDLNSTFAEAILKEK